MATGDEPLSFFALPAIHNWVALLHVPVSVLSFVTLRHLLQQFTSHLSTEDDDRIHLRKMFRPALLQSNHRAAHRAVVASLEDSFRRLSTRGARNFSSVQVQDADDVKPAKQAFVTAKIEPGEWDPARTDPLYRPKFKSNSKIISAEDFANRPPVAFNGEFATYEDGMITLSWLDQKTCRQIYHMYVDMMVMSHKKYEKTSHEYVTKVIAQKFNITPWRAAGVVQLQHSEEQMRQHHPELLAEDQANYAEQQILKNIRDAYKAERSDPPDNFVEDPVGLHGRGEPDEISSQWTRTEDIFDMDQKLEDANVRDTKDARLLIDGHVYWEDTDDNSAVVKVDASSRRLLKNKERLEKTKVETEPIPYPEKNGDGEKRPRWKFVAQIVDTRNMRNKGRKSKTYTNDNTENTLVEEDGKLRVATVAESKQVAWKRVRVGNEYIYHGAKRAWLDKMVSGKTEAWGLGPISKAPQPKKEATLAKEETKEKEVVVEAKETEIEAKAEESSDSSSSDSDSSESDKESDGSKGESDSDSDSDSDTDSEKGDKLK